MGQCCTYVAPSKDKTIHSGGGGGSSPRSKQSQRVSQDKEIYDVLNNLQGVVDDKLDDQGETSSQPSNLYMSSLVVPNIHSMIQNHGTVEMDDQYNKQPFYGAEALSYVMEMNLSSLAKEEVSQLAAEQISLEVKEQIKLTISHSMDIIDLERRKSEIIPVAVSQETLAVMNPEEKDEMIRRTSSQFEQQQNILKLQQQQLLHQQQLLEKQQKIILQQQIQQQQKQQQQQQLANALKQQVFMKTSTLSNINGNTNNLSSVTGPTIQSIPNLSDSSKPKVILTSQQNQSQSIVLIPQQTQNKLTPQQQQQIIQQQQQLQQQQLLQQQQQQQQQQQKPGVGNAATGQQLKPMQQQQQQQQRGRENNDPNGSMDNKNNLTPERPRSILKQRRGNSAHSNKDQNSPNASLNTSFDSVDSNGSKQSQMKKKVKFKDSTFKKSTKKKRY